MNLLPAPVTDGIQSALRRVGIDVHRWKRAPRYTLLGLRTMPIRTIVDVGANVGQFAKWISTIFPAARVYAFEPVPDPYAELSAWARSQDRRVQAFNVALGDTEAEVDIEVPAGYTDASSLLPATTLNDALYPWTRQRRRLRVREETLDGVVARHHLDLRPDVLVKLDVQGFEQHVIAGGRRVLATARACISEVNLDALYHGQPRFVNLVRALEELGLAYAGNLAQYCAADGHVVYLDAVFLRRID